MNLLDDLSTRGFCKLEGVFSTEDLGWFRRRVLSHTHLMRNTRPTKSALHLAGFCRYSSLRSLENEILENTAVVKFFGQLFGTDTPTTIGLSDITINRSQHWHTDLLRGKYRHYLDDIDIWGGVGGCYKLLLYLQPGDSLRVRPGSHHQPMDLRSDLNAIPDNTENVCRVSVNAGDIVVMDLRLVHRGSSEGQMQKLGNQEKKILISTVVCGSSFPMRAPMQQGNAHRLKDWDKKHPAPHRLVG